MNPPLPGAGAAGGGLLPNIPLYYPPVSVKWMLTILLIFVGSVANRFKPEVRQYFTNPIGFFAIAVLAFATFKHGFHPLAFALLFVLLTMWATQTSEGFACAAKNIQYAGQENYPQFFEGFLGGMDNIEWVTNHKRWFVERILKEHPEAIVDKGVLTLPISGFSAQGSTANGST
jgi:hypothetical protein